MRQHLSLFSAVIAVALAILAPNAVEPAPRAGPFERGALGKSASKNDWAGNEAKAQEPEKQRDWDTAAQAYRIAGRTAAVSGQYQKAIAHGTKALEMGERAGQTAGSDRGDLAAGLRASIGHDQGR